MVCACLTLNHLSAWHASFSGARISGSTPRFLMAPAEGPGVESKYCLGRISEMGGKRGPAHVTLQRTTGFPADVHYHSHMAFEYLGSFRAHGNSAAIWGIWQGGERSNTHTHSHMCEPLFVHSPSRLTWWLMHRISPATPTNECAKDPGIPTGMQFLPALVKQYK